MATRHQARTAVIGLLYAYDLGNENIAKFSDEILEEDKIRNKNKESSLIPSLMVPLKILHLLTMPSKSILKSGTITILVK